MGSRAGAPVLTTNERLEALALPVLVAHRMGVDTLA